MTESEDIPPPEIAPPIKTSGLGNIAVATKKSGQSGNKLFSGGLGALAVALIYYAKTAKVDDPVFLYCGLLMIVGAALPSLLWAKRADNRFPVFEVLMLTGINTYAIPLLSGHRQLQLYPGDTIMRAATGVLLFQLVANVSYAMTRGRAKTSPNWTREIMTANIANYLGYGMIITTAYTIISQFTDWIPYDLNPAIRAVSFGVGIISTFIQSRMWGQGTLPRYRKGIFVFQLVLQVIFSWAALLLIGGLSILILALLGYISGGKKIPILPLVIVLPIVALLHTGKSVMRAKYWEGGTPMPTLTEVPAFYAEWVGYAVSPDPEDERIKDKREGALLLERTSLFHMLCLVADCTPARQPYLDGETYGYVPAQLIPSFFWHGKPPSHIATYRLSVYYGLQSPEDTARTTIAFGLLAEAYANFGYFGIVLLAFAQGFWIKKIGDWSRNSPILSYPGLFLIVLMAWSFQSELTMAAWISSFYQACIAVIGVPFVLRNFIGG